MKMIQKSFIAVIVLLMSISSATAADYVIDTKGGHAAINFKFKHIGISWLVGEFKTFSGSFSFDPENVEASSIIVDIDTTSLDSNHAERDKHIRAENRLNTDDYPTAKFVSTRVESTADETMTVYGDLTLRGVTKEIAIAASTVGAGDDPWGGYRVGLEGTTTLDMRDFGSEGFGPTHMIDMLLYVEGIQEK